MTKTKNKKEWNIKTASKNEIMVIRVLLIILGIMLLLMGFVFFVFIPFAILSFYLAYACKKELKRRKEVVVTSETIKASTAMQNTQIPLKNTVKVTDINGSEFEVSIYQALDTVDRVLIAEGGRTYHTHLSCFKNWTGDAQRNFTGWKIVKKSEISEQNMRYCSFCAESDKITLADLLEDSEEEHDEEEL